MNGYTGKSEMPYPEVYIIILNYKGWEDTIECLESVYRSAFRNFQVIVADNCSGNQSLERIAEWAEGKRLPGKKHERAAGPPVIKPVPYRFFSTPDAKAEEHPVSDSPFHPMWLLQTGENKGFSSGNNAVLRRLPAGNPKAYVWLLNPDMVVERETLGQLVAFMEEKGNERSVTGGAIYDYDDPSRIQFYGGAVIHRNTGTIRFVKDPRKISSLDYISGGFLFTPLDNFLTFGLLPEEYFLYWEETDWCARLPQEVSLRVCLNAIAYNKGSTSVGKGYLSEYYYTLNALRFAEKYTPSSVKWILFSNLLRSIKRIAERRFGNFYAIYRAQFHYLRNVKGKL